MNKNEYDFDYIVYKIHQKIDGLEECLQGGF